MSLLEQRQQHDGLGLIQPQADRDGAMTIDFSAAAGLYQLSVVVDASRFDWDSLYFPLHLFGNRGERVGPWDFDFRNANVPLVPAYRVSVDGRYIGLWFFQRVSLEDIAHKRFRGRMAFCLDQGGSHRLQLVPFRLMDVSWLWARLEVDPEDQLAPLPVKVLPAVGNTVYSRWNDGDFWQQQRQRLQTTHACYAPLLERSRQWALAAKTKDAESIALLAAIAQLRGGDEAALLRALELVDHYLNLPAWGNANPDGYSHNGDMGAGFAFRGLALAWHILGPQMGPERCQKLLDKLTCQGDIFLDLALLNRDYWGGSLLQDHGWEALMYFASGALLLHGVVPQAQRWLRYALPRMQRSFDALPIDGVMPASSYYSPWMYVEALAFYRDLLRELSGQDIYDQPAFAPIARFVAHCYHPGKHQMLLTNTGESVPLIGGNNFFTQMAAKSGDPLAAWVHQRLVAGPSIEFYHGRQESGFFHSALWGFFSYDPTIAPAASVGPPPGAPQLGFFEDSGLAHFRHDDVGLRLTVQCGPWCGYNSYRKAQGPCDRMESAPGAGHFSLYLDGQPLLVTPDGGYRLHSFLRTCLLIDGRGQYGDVGHPMSIPSKQHRGEEVELARWDPAAGQGLIRLKLHPAYPDDLGVAHYTRELILTSSRKLIVRDHIALDQPRVLTWLFQGKRAFGVGVENGRGWMGTERKLWLDAQTASPLELLPPSLQETQVVWSYASASGFAPFDHLRYQSAKPVRAAAVDFVLSW